MRTRVSIASAAILAAAASPARAAEPTPGYPEAVIQWGVQKGETCDDVAKAVYGSAQHVGLLLRYNRVACKPKTPLPEGLTLVLPAKVGTVPDAKLRSMNPDVRARPPGSGWAPAATGMPLYSNSSVNTLDKGRADVEFVDRTRVFLAPNTLVVIFGTANQTSVSKTPPAAVEVESGEVKAGLSALRGDTVEVATKSGGRVSAASRDTVVQQKGDRTTVEVFHGKAGVKSGGKAVQVPLNFGTRFVGNTPPAPPRPLPPAPTWTPEPGETKESVLAESVALAPAGKGILAASWNAVPVAASYRIEVSRDEVADKLVEPRVIELQEVPADIHALRLENLRPGTYRVRVRAIDKEEYLGVASTDRVVRLVEAAADAGGAVTPRSIRANPYGRLQFVPSPDLEMALDDGPFGPVLANIDLRRHAPRRILIRGRGGSGQAIQIEYEKVGAEIEAKPSADRRSVAVKVKPYGLAGLDVADRVAPSLRVHLPGEVKQIAVVQRGADFTATVPLPAGASAAGPLRIDFVDGRGSVLGTTTADLTEKKGALGDLPPAPEKYPRIGTALSLWPISPVTDVFWFAPTAENEGAAGVGLGRAGGAWTFQGQARASGAIAGVGLDAAIRTESSGDRANGDGAAWFGARVRVSRYRRSVFELAPALRLSVPTSTAGAPARLEGSAALGGALGRFTWLADLGWRVRLANDGGKAGSPPIQGFLLAGATFDPIPWLRLHALVDAHLVRRDGEDAPKDFLGGLGAGVEAGRTVFGSASLRASPFNVPGESPFAAQLGVGVREAAP